MPNKLKLGTAIYALCILLSILLITLLTLLILDSPSKVHMEDTIPRMEVREQIYVPPQDSQPEGDTQSGIQPDSVIEDKGEEDTVSVQVDFTEEVDYCQSDSEQYSTYSGDFKSEGVVYEDGVRYTWYSQKVLTGTGLDELNSNGRHVDESGFIRDGDGYLVIASSDHSQGTLLETPFGTGKVYDSGCASGTIDMYTDF